MFESKINLSSRKAFASLSYIPVETVRNFFGDTDFINESSIGFHLKPSPCGGIATLDDTTVLDKAIKI